VFRAYKPTRVKEVRVLNRKVKIVRGDKTYEYSGYILTIYVYIPKDWIEMYGDKWVVEIYYPDRRRVDPRPRIIAYPGVYKEIEENKYDRDLIKEIMGGRFEEKQ